MQNARQLQQVCELVGAATEGSATAAHGGAPVDLDGGFYYPPTVLPDVSNADKVARTEVFGPVVAAVPFEDEEHAIVLANDTAYGLAGAVWTGSVDRAHRVARAVRAGTVWINSYKTINVMSPFGRFGDSGYGRSNGRNGLAEYTQAKSVWCETAADAPCRLATDDPFSGDRNNGIGLIPLSHGFHISHRR